MTEELRVFTDYSYSEAVEAVYRLDNDERMALARAIETFTEALDETRRERGQA